MFDKNTTTKIIVAVGLLLISSVASKYVKNYLVEGEQRDDYTLIKKYLLNDTLYRASRPNLWIHTKYEYNSRVWKSFGSRSSYNLNQPYLHLTIRSIIYHCSADFNICLIDDDSFMRLVPGWKYDLNKMAEPFRTFYRELGLIRTIQEYGGMLVPNSFLCFKNMISLYKDNISRTPFVAENISRTTSHMEFSPDFHFMGAAKNSPIMQQMGDYLENRNKYPHYTSEFDLLGDMSKWIESRVKTREIRLLSANMIGVMDENRKPIRLDNLMEEDYLELSRGAYGIYIPADEILRRPKYQWFATIPGEDVLQGTTILSKYFINVFDPILREQEGAGAQQRPPPEQAPEIKMIL